MLRSRRRVPVGVGDNPTQKILCLYTVEPQDTLLGPQGVHNRGVPLQDTLLGPRGVHNRGVPLHIYVCTPGFNPPLVASRQYIFCLRLCIFERKCHFTEKTTDISSLPKMNNLTSCVAANMSRKPAHKLLRHGMTWHTGDCPGRVRQAGWGRTRNGPVCLLESLQVE